MNEKITDSVCYCQDTELTGKHMQSDHTTMQIKADRKQRDLDVQDNTMTIDMSHVSELAHELTRHECDKLGIVCDEMDDNGDTKYTPESQPVFDKYYDLIINTLNF